MNLNDRVSLITGSARGIGKAIAEELADAGSDIVVIDLSQKDCDGVAKELSEKNDIISKGYELDVTDRESVEDMKEEILNDFDRVDHIVNNAGITQDSLLMRMKDDQWESVLDVNLNGVYNVTKAFLRQMMKNRYGRIVNVASVVGQMGNAGQTNYGASKAGVIGFTKSLAREVAKRNITVNAVAPGYIKTAMTEELSEDVKDELRSMIPAEKLGLAEDVAYGVKFLISEEAGYITGDVLNVNGGMYM